MRYSSSFSAGDSGVNPSKCVSNWIEPTSDIALEADDRSNVHCLTLLSWFPKSEGLEQNVIVAVFQWGSASSDASDPMEWILKSLESS